MMLCVAHYNLSVENEFVGDYNEAIINISEAMNVAKAHLGN